MKSVYRRPGGLDATNQIRRKLAILYNGRRRPAFGKPWTGKRQFCGQSEPGQTRGAALLSIKSVDEVRGACPAPSQSRGRICLATPSQIGTTNWRRQLKLSALVDINHLHCSSKAGNASPELALESSQSVSRPTGSQEIEVVRKPSALEIALGRRESRLSSLSCRLN